MKIAVVEIKTGNTACIAEVRVGGVNYQPSLEEAFFEAWSTPCEDGIVSPDKRADFRFVVLAEEA